MSPALRYRDLIVRAVTTNDTQLLDQIATHLVDCEQAKQMLIAKGYGSAAVPTSALARLVPVVSRN